MTNLEKKFRILLIFILWTNVILAQQKLLIPPVIEGENIELTLQKASHEFYKGVKTQTLGINGNILGPTIMLNKGQQVNFSVNNKIGEITTIHWHGMHVSAMNDGGPHTTIANDKTWRPSFKVLDKAATYWYHPHLHKKTNDHVLKGLAGFIIVKDSEEAALDLPRTYGVDDIPVVIQTKTFDSKKQIVLGASALDKEVLANATREAFVDVPAQIIRLRLLNGASQRFFELGLSNNLSFYQIATDGGLLSSAIKLNRLRLAPGERAEILINLNDAKGKKITLKNYGSELPTGYYGAKQIGMNPRMTIPNYNNNPLNGETFNILELRVGQTTSNAIKKVANKLVKLNLLSSMDVDVQRNLIFSAKDFGPQNMVNGPFVINGESFKLQVINQRIKLNNTEIWTLTNQSMVAHPFHIHDVQFYILNRNGQPVPKNERGRKDVVIVPPRNGTVSFITKFEDFSDDEVPYMYHCHMLTHEDEGMMGQFVVEGQITSITSDNKKIKIKYFPNPTKDVVFIEGIRKAKVEIIDAVGKRVDNFEADNDLTMYDLSGFKIGLYFFKIKMNDQSSVIKIVKK